MARRWTRGSISCWVLYPCVTSGSRRVKRSCRDGESENDCPRAPEPDTDRTPAEGEQHGWGWGNWLQYGPASGWAGPQPLRIAVQADARAERGTVQLTGPGQSVAPSSHSHTHTHSPFPSTASAPRARPGGRRAPPVTASAASQRLWTATQLVRRGLLSPTPSSEKTSSEEQLEYCQCDQVTALRCLGPRTGGAAGPVLRAQQGATPQAGRSMQPARLT